jgi:hypothetical protein
MARKMGYGAAGRRKGRNWPAAAWEARSPRCAERSSETWKSEASAVAGRTQASGASVHSVGSWAGAAEASAAAERRRRWCGRSRWRRRGADRRSMEGARGVVGDLQGVQVRTRVARRTDRTGEPARREEGAGRQRISLDAREAGKL